MLGPISGSHFNPAVSLGFWTSASYNKRRADVCCRPDIGGIVGTMIAHLMFALQLLSEAMKIRTGGGQWFAEAVASFGLIATILAGLRFERRSVPWLSAVLVYGVDIVCQSGRRGGAFADKHVFRDSAAGPSRFYHRQLCGAIIGMFVIGWLLREVNRAAPVSKDVQPRP